MITRANRTRWAGYFAIALSAAGCAASRPAPTPVATLGVMLPPSERPFWEPIARRFERDHPGTRVELIEGPNSTDLRENLYTSLLALDHRLSADERQSFLPAALAAGEFGDSLYRVPLRTDVGLLYYRVDLL